MIVFSKLFYKFKKCSHFKQNVLGFKKMFPFKKCSICLFLVFFFTLEFSENVLTFEMCSIIWKQIMFWTICSRTQNMFEEFEKMFSFLNFVVINLKMFCNFKKCSSLFNFVHILKKCSSFLIFCKNCVLNKLFVI